MLTLLMTGGTRADGTLMKTRVDSWEIGKVKERERERE
jgi:hypothetical protein